MSENYTPPPGRPQATPPDLAPTSNDHPDFPRREGESSTTYQLRLNHYLAKADPLYKAVWEDNKRAGLLARIEKENGLAMTECRRRNRDETRGRWFTRRTFMRMYKLASNPARYRLNEDSIDRFCEHGNVVCYLVPFDKLPDATPAPVVKQAAPPPPITTLGHEVIVRRVTITRPEIEAHLLQLRGLKRAEFQWSMDGTVFITSEE